MKHYVIDRRKGFVTHEGDRNSCEHYVRTCQGLWGRKASDFEIAEGAKKRDEILKGL